MGKNFQVTRKLNFFLMNSRCLSHRRMAAMCVHVYVCACSLKYILCNWKFINFAA